MGMALQSGSLSPDECDVIAYYAKELHDTTHPLCEKRECNPKLQSK